MKHGWLIALLMVPALLIHSGCEDEAANRRAAAAEKKKAEEAKSSYEECESLYNTAMAKEKANSLVEAQTLFQSVANMASEGMAKGGEYRMKYMSISSQANAAVSRVKAGIEQAQKIAAAEADKAKRDKEAEAALAAKEKELAAKQAQGSAPAAGVAATTTALTDPTTKTPAPAAGGGEDDDALTALKTAKEGNPGGAGAAGAAAGAGDAAKVPTDPFTPFDDKAGFKCYAVKSAKRYVIAYCIIRNTSQKELRIVRPVAQFSSDRGENTWPVAVMFEYSKFQAKDWSDLDKDNPEPVGNERIVLAPGDAVKLVLMSDKAERDNEYAKAVKLVGGVLWHDGSETTVINNN